MTDDTRTDALLYRWTDDAVARPLHPALIGARADVVDAARGLLAIPEAALAQPWAWIGGSEEEVRYGAYRAAESLELAEIEARTAASSGYPSETIAARLVGPTTAARWDLHGLLMPLDDALLDADPGNGEWSIRLTMGHIIGGQRGYGWGGAWWLSQGYAAGDPAMPGGAPDDLWDGLPDEATSEAAGTVSGPPEAPRRGDRPHRRALRGHLGRAGRLRGDLGGLPGDARVPLRAMVVAHPRARDPDREDLRDGRARAGRARTARTQPAGGLRACRVRRLCADRCR